MTLMYHIKMCMCVSSEPAPGLLEKQIFSEEK